MNFIKRFFIWFFVGIITVSGIYFFYSLQKQIWGEGMSGRPLIVCTTSIIADTVKMIVEDCAEVTALMGPGIDPHLYKARPRDIYALNNAQIIFFNGLHLEGKMVDILEKMENDNRFCYAVTAKLDRALLRETDYEGIYDPHVWFDLMLWKNVTEYIGECLIKALPDCADKIAYNTQKICSELIMLDQKVYDLIQIIPENKRILITAHDAFGYFGKRYNIHVEGLQGISTDAEIKIDDIQRIAEIIIRYRVPTIFVEQTISDRYLRGVQDLVQAHGISVKIGDQLYSDALGEEGSGAETYYAMIMSNVQAIIKGLQGE